MVFGERRMTYGELNDEANRVAHALLSLGVRQGEKVALLAVNCPEYLPVYFGVVKVGAVFVSLNFRYAPEEFVYVLGDSEAVVLLHGQEFRPAVQAIRSRLPGLRSVVEIGADPAPSEELSYAALLSRQPASEPSVPVEEDDECGIFYTSGTTGRPKGAVHSHRSLLESTVQIALATRVGAWDVVLVTTPLFHGGGLLVATQPHLYMGARVVILPRFDPAAALETMAREGVTTFFGVPSQYTMLLEVADQGRYDLRSLRAAWYGAAPMPLEVLKRCLAMWPRVGFYQLYGQTETTLITVLGPEEHDAKLGATGRALVGVEMRVVDEAGREVPPDAVGEVVVRREHGMKGYHRQPGETREVIRGGWIHTGDLARVDEDGYITLVDRKRDVIISGGENIYPKEIEEVLYGHPAVLEAAVVGVPDHKWGEVPCAFVVAREGQGVSPDDLTRWCEGRLARYKWPRQWRFVEELPKTANGKVRKNVLRATL